MKNSFIIGLILLLSSLLITCNEENPNEKMQTTNENGFDSTLAAELGADEYGMKSYVIAFLKTGPNKSEDKDEAARLQRAHLDNIVRMSEDGSLVLAGPFLDNSEIRGIYIFNVATIEEAQALTATDPAIKAGVLVMELHPWYGSAALPKLSEIHKKLAEKSI